VAAGGGAPRELGAAMAVRMRGGEPGEVVGSVSGGCIEASVYEVSAEVLAAGRPRLEVYGVGDAEAVGLTCGGTLSVFVMPSTLGTEDLMRASEAVSRGEGAGIAMVVAGPEKLVGPYQGDVFRARGLDALADAIERDVEAMVSVGESGRRSYQVHDGCPVADPGASPLEASETGAGVVTVFVSVLAEPPRLVILGALDYAASLATVGRFLGYRVTVCDARAVFATAERFPDAHEVVVAWPHTYLAETPLDSRSAVCVLTHDPKFDVPALETALRSEAAYVGAMGSRRTCADRLARLRAAGLSEDELARLSAPIGLDLGAATPQETAVAIAAELIAVRRQGSGERLRATTGPIHR
jgi:xanthine dehydrogenase accessory factor